MNVYRKIIPVLLLVFLITNGYSINLKDYIFVVEPEIHTKTQNTFYKVADHFSDNDMEEVSKIFRSFADGGHGTGFLVKDDNEEFYIITNRHCCESCRDCKCSKI